MSKTASNDEKKEHYADLLKRVHNQATVILKKISWKKSDKWHKDVRYRPERILLCHLHHLERSNLCTDRNCSDIGLCQNYKRVRDFFLPFGYIIYPYTVSIDSLPTDKTHSKIIGNMGFYDDSISNVLFVNSVCFTDSFKDHPLYSAVNEAIHELLHAISSYYIEYDILMASINRETFVKYLSEPNYVDNLLMIYDISELKTTNEPIHQFIANNKDTKCLLDAIFRRDKDYQPPIEYSDLYKQLLYLLDTLEVGI